MPNPLSPGRSRSALCAVVLSAAALAACGTTAAPHHVNLQDDYRTCSEFGSAPGSRAYSDCMVAQQRRRDDAGLNEARKNQLINEGARDAYATAEQARRDRCRRDPNRRECGR